MHELSLALEVLDMVQAAERRDGFGRVGALRLEVGALAGVEVEALRFALETIAPGTCLAQARILIETPPGTAWCGACSREVSITHYLDTCPACAAPLTRQTGGDGLRVLDLLVLGDRSHKPQG